MIDARENLYNLNLKSGALVYQRLMAYKNLRKILKAAGKTQVDLAEVLSKTPAVITNLFNGTRRLKADEVVKIAQWLDISSSEILDQSDGRVPVVGSIGAGAKVYPIDDLPLIPPEGFGEANNDYVNCEFVDAPPGVYPNGVVALRVIGDSMLPFMTEGTLIFYTRRTSGDFKDFINKQCVVCLKDGQVLLKILKRGYSYGKYNLMSYNAEIIEDAELQWCAKIEYIKPA